MKKIYVFSLEGLVFTINEDGCEKSSSVSVGFLQESKEFQDNFLMDKFQELTEKFKTEYKVISIISEDDKEELSLAIKKLIDDYKTNRPASSDIEFWEDKQVQIKEPIFDRYNKNIWQKINQDLTV